MNARRVALALAHKDGHVGVELVHKGGAGLGRNLLQPVGKLAQGLVLHVFVGSGRFSSMGWGVRNGHSTPWACSTLAICSWLRT